LDGVEIPQWVGQFLGLSGPLKIIVSLCCGVHSKRGHSVILVLNNGAAKGIIPSAMMACSYRDHSVFNNGM